MKKALVLSFILFFLAVPGLTAAQEAEPTPPRDYLLVDDLPFIRDVAVTDSENGLALYLQGMFRLGIGLAITFAFFMIVVGGLKYMVTDVPGVKVNAKGDIWNAVSGLVLAAGAWLILTTINPDLVKFNFLRRINDIVVPPPAEVVPDEGLPPDGRFDYDSSPNGGDIVRQTSHAAPELQSLLSCMAGNVPGNVGRISSISDNLIVLNQKTFAECAGGGVEAAGCAHRPESQHYGGKSCVGKSYAVDFGDEWNDDILARAAQECHPDVEFFYHNDHLHVSIGKASGCGGSL